MSHHPTRRLAAALSLSAAVLSTGALSSIASAQDPSAGAAPDQIRIAYQSIPNGDLVVKHEGWLEAALPDTQIVWTKFDSGGDVNTAILAGAIDIGLAGSSPVTRGLSAPNHIPYQVPWIFDVIGTAESLIVRNATGITDVAGLAGQKIGTPFASTAHYSLLAALKEAGLSEADVTIIDLQPQDILAAWQRGDIAAAYVWSPTLDELRADGTIVADSATLAGLGYPTFDLAVVTNDFASRYPAAVQEWLRQQDRAVQLILDDPAAASVPIAAELSITPEEVQAQLDGLVFVGQEEQRSETYLGTPEAPGQFAAGLLKAAEFLKGQGSIDEVPTLETLQAGIDTADLAAAFADR